MTRAVMTLAVYEREVRNLCARLGAPEGLDVWYIARRLPIEEIEAELRELAARRSRTRTA
jgi:hypothetical protein